MARKFSLDDRVWAINGDRTDPDTVTTSEASLLNVADGHIDSQGPFSDIMNWEQYRVSHMLNAMEQYGVLEWSPKTKYGTRGLCVADNGQLMQSRKANNINHPLSDTSWWIEYVPTGMGDMLTSVYDTNGNGIVDKASSVDGVTGSGNSTYYGKDSTGNVGFHSIPPDGDMKKSVYDTNNNGRVDNADSVFGVDSAGAEKYYGTDTNGTKGFFDLPPKGDMLKSVYDSTDSGRVDVAESLFGIASAKALTYYGKDKDGTEGFFEFISQLPETATRWPTAFEVGALDINGQAKDSEKLEGMGRNVNPIGNTVPSRDSEGSIHTRLFRSTHQTQTTGGIIPDAGICFRNNNTTDNYMRFIDKAGIKSWLSLTKSDVALSNVQNYPVSHIASGAANSKSKYASEYAVGVAWKLAKQAYDATLVGGKVDSAQTSDKLSVSRVIALNGDVVGSVNFDGSQNVNMSTSVADNSHKHVWDNITDSPVYTKRWPTPAEVGVRTNAQNDARFLGKKAKAIYASKADYLSASDLRNVKPNTTGLSGLLGVKPFFISNSAIGITGGGSYSDMLVLDTYGGPKGGNVNAIVASKGTDKLYHVQGDWGADHWGTPAKIYTEAQKPTAADVGALPANGKAADTDRVGDTGLGKTATGYITIPNADWYGRKGVGHSQMVKADSVGLPIAHDGFLMKTGGLDTGVGGPWIFISDYRGDTSRMWFGVSPNLIEVPKWVEAYSAHHKPTAADVGALPAEGKAKDSEKLEGMVRNVNPIGNTVPSRDSEGSIHARLFRSTHQTQTTGGIIPDAGICFRNGNTTDNYMRFIDKAGLLKWLFKGAAVGTPNILINTDVLHVVNQRDFNGNWNNLTIGKYGYDRWLKADATHKGQIVESGNFVPNATYTLGYNMGSLRTFTKITAPASGHWLIKAPFNATMLDAYLGTVERPWDPENASVDIAKCQRYYFKSDSSFFNPLYAASLGSTLIHTLQISFPTTMRISPKTNWVQNGTWTGTSGFGNAKADGYFRQWNGVTDGNYVGVKNFIADAELTLADL